MYQLLLKNAEFFAEGRFNHGDIYVKDGKIALIALSDTPAMPAAKTIDCQGLKVLPGIIDAHVHVREPGVEHREDFYTGTQAAAAGGVTTFCEMPLAVPPPYSAEVLANRVRLAEEKCLVDFAMYGAAGFENRHDLQEVIDGGVIAFKTFLHPAPEGREKEFKGLTVEDDGQLFLMLQEAAKTDCRYFFHAENAKLIKQLENYLHEQGVNDNSFHYLSRANVAETTSVATIIEFARVTGCKVGIAHISAPEACALVKQAQAEGVDIEAETCFHYLSYDHSDIDKHGPYAKCNPPVRSAEDKELLWEYLLDGTISLVSSDHAPFSPDEKSIGLTDGIWKAYSGMPSIEMLAPFMLNHVANGRLSLEQFCYYLSENVARLHGLFPQKGLISLGSDADFTIVDMEKSYKIELEKMYTKSKAVNLLFDQVPIKGQVKYTIVRGRAVMENGLVDLEAKGHGQYIRPQR